MGHPGYLGYTEQGYDLAIVKLNQSVGSARILHMCRSDEKYAQGYTLAVCGFGLTIPHGGFDADPGQLKEAQVQDTSADGSCGVDQMFNKDKFEKPPEHVPTKQLQHERSLRRRTPCRRCL